MDNLPVWSRSYAVPGGGRLKLAATVEPAGHSHMAQIHATVLGSEDITQDEHPVLVTHRLFGDHAPAVSWLQNHAPAGAEHHLARPHDTQEHTMSTRRSMQEIYYSGYEDAGFKSPGRYDTPVWSHVQKTAGGGTVKTMASHSYSPTFGGHRATITAEMHPNPEYMHGKSSSGSYVHSKSFETKADAINWLRSQAPSSAKQHYQDSDLEPEAPSSESLKFDREFDRMVREDSAEDDLHIKTAIRLGRAALDRSMMSAEQLKDHLRSKTDLSPEVLEDVVHHLLTETVRAS